MQDLELCKEFLKEELKDGQWHDAEDIRAIMAGYGVKKNIFKQARQSLRVKTKNNGDGTWSWRIEK